MSDKASIVPRSLARIGSTGPSGASSARNQATSATAAMAVAAAAARGRAIDGGPGSTRSAPSAHRGDATGLLSGSLPWAASNRLLALSTPPAHQSTSPTQLNQRTVFGAAGVSPIEHGSQRHRGERAPTPPGSAHNDGSGGSANSSFTRRRLRAAAGQGSDEELACDVPLLAPASGTAPYSAAPAPHNAEQPAPPPGWKPMPKLDPSFLFG